MGPILALKKEVGFSLVELVATIGIVGILVVLASLSMGFIREERVRSATRELLADLQKARVDALTTGPGTATPLLRGVGVRFESSTTYKIFWFNDSGAKTYEYDDATEEVAPVTKTMPDSLRIQVRDDAVPSPLGYPVNTVRIFDRFGQARLTDWGMGMSPKDLTVVIRHVSSQYSKCIDIDGAKIREGMWNDVSQTCSEQ